ncbi:hypothetical protein H4Q26_000280 [Puccinia striiformis f. sp. tritici PST-130]|nr:hypothetical protein H4Q26_000280 [Puccinia striiformis f. sp. tritici PST-130]
MKNTLTYTQVVSSNSSSTNRLTGYLSVHLSLFAHPDLASPIPALELHCLYSGLCYRFNPLATPHPASTACALAELNPHLPLFSSLAPVTPNLSLASRDTITRNHGSIHICPPRPSASASLHHNAGSNSPDQHALSQPDGQASTQTSHHPDDPKGIITNVQGIVPTFTFFFLLPPVHSFTRNIVATVNLECRLDLKTIALHARNAEYNPKVLFTFCCRDYADSRAQNNGTDFASGKMVVTGAKSEDDSRLAARKYARIVQKLGFEAKFTEFKIQNIVGSCDVRFPNSAGRSSLQPRALLVPKVVLLIFVSGKIVLTGAKVSPLPIDYHLRPSADQLTPSTSGARGNLPSLQQHLPGTVRVPKP